MQRTGWVLTLGGLALSWTGAMHASDAPPIAVDPAAIHFALETMRVTGDYPASLWSVRRCHSIRSCSTPSGWDGIHSTIGMLGVAIMLAVSSGPDWRILWIGPGAGQARMDDGESLSPDPFPRSMAGLSAENPGFRAPGALESGMVGHRSTGVRQLLPPGSPAMEISALQGTGGELAGGNDAHLDHVHVVPGAGKLQRVPGVPDCDLAMGLASDGSLQVTFSAGNLDRCRQIRYRAADGSEFASSGFSATQQPGQSISMRISMPKALAAIDLDFYQPMPVQADFSLAHPPLAGHSRERCVGDGRKRLPGMRIFRHASGHRRQLRARSRPVSAGPEGAFHPFLRPQRIGRPPVSGPAACSASSSAAVACRAKLLLDRASCSQNGRTSGLHMRHAPPEGIPGAARPFVPNGAGTVP